VAFRETGKQESAYHEFLGHIANQYHVLAITGTHGKSSTTAFLAHIFIEAGLDPLVVVGAGMPTLPGKHARYSKGKYFIVEADEYRNHFYALEPNNIIITSVDFDHPDSFSSLQDVEKSYSHFIGQLREGGTVFVPEQEYRGHQNISWPKDSNIIPTENSDDIVVPLPGEHMRRNASLAVALAEKFGITREKAIESLKTFPGLSRRFELLGKINNTEIRSDYGHHPTEITATIAGAREFAPNTRIVALFEAHMPQRLHAFFDDFASALALADEVIITKPFIPAGRDEEVLDDIYRLKDVISSKNIPVKCIFDDTELYTAIATKEPCIALIFSAGTLDGRMRELVKNI
jgi:UDP-N-acetylmuramate--alanine ligase